MGYLLLIYSTTFLLVILFYYEIYERFFVRYNEESDLNEWASREAEKIQKNSR